MSAAADGIIERGVRGTLKSYDRRKHYGWITRDDNKGDVFFHAEDVRRGDSLLVLTSFAELAWVFVIPEGFYKAEFNVEDGSGGKKKATDVHLIRLDGTDLQIW